MARSASTSERSIPHLRDIFWSNAAPAASPAQRPAEQWRRPGHDDVNGLAYQIQSDLRVSNRGGKGAGKDHHSHHSNYYHNSIHHSKQQQQQQSAINDLGNDSAISVGSTSEDEHQSAPTSKKKSKKSRARDNARTLTERDVKHLERHLSMKKTIRKKIMRDLQQAFVEDPTEFRVEDINSHEQLIQSLSFGTPSRHAARHSSRESNFLDMLRANGGPAMGPGMNPAMGPAPSDLGPARSPACDDQDSGHGSPRGSPTRELSADRAASVPVGPAEYDEGGLHDADSTGKKTSFWKRFTMKGKSKR